jgi:hypothetical protein
MKKRSDWDVLMEAEEELHWARSDLVYNVNKYLDAPKPYVLKDVQECLKWYAHWFKEVEQLRTKVGKKLRRQR